jgi:predicted nucleic acid-binding Zn ribbon protein
MGSKSEPQPLARVLSELIARRGFARVKSDEELQVAWTQVAGRATARQTRAVAVRRGVLQVSVASSSLLEELAGFYRAALVEKLRTGYPNLAIKDIKFRLDSVLTNKVNKE